MAARISAGNPANAGSTVDGASPAAAPPVTVGVAGVSSVVVVAGVVALIVGDGAVVGVSVGTSVGISVGVAVGTSVGISDGVSVGTLFIPLCVLLVTSTVPATSSVGVTSAGAVAVTVISGEVGRTGVALGVLSGVFVIACVDVIVCPALVAAVAVTRIAVAVGVISTLGAAVSDVVAGSVGMGVAVEIGAVVGIGWGVRIAAERVGTRVGNELSSTLPPPQAPRRRIRDKERVLKVTSFMVYSLYCVRIFTNSEDCALFARRCQFHSQLRDL